MEKAVQKLFERYEQTFMKALGGDMNMKALAALYAPQFIAATPIGVTTGKNDKRLEETMAKGYARYRSIGTKAMRIRDVRVSPIDEQHCVAHVAWTATYAREGRADIEIDFDVHYFVRTLNGVARVFGWVSGDEEALLRKHGIV